MPLFLWMTYKNRSSYGFLHRIRAQEYQLVSAFDLELVEDIVKMILDRLFRDAEIGGNSPVAPALKNE